MKKKFSIVISLAFLLFAFNSCEQEDQISYINSVEPSISIDKNTSEHLQSGSVTKEEVEDESCEDPVETQIMAGQHIEVGNLFISNSETELFVTYDLSGTEWWLKETHLFAGNLNDAPFTNSGNPQIGKFPYHGPDELTQKYTYVISLDSISEPISIIAHAVVVQKQDGQVTANETAFGVGSREFEGNRWGWIIDYELQECDEENQENSEDGEDGEGGENDENDENDEDDDSETSEEEAEEITQDTGNEGETVDTVTDQNNENGCMDAYAYSGPDSSVCLSRDFDQWGWTNKVGPNDQHYVPGGETYTYPLYASAFDCAIDNSILVGEVKVTVSGGDSVLYGSITVNLTKQELSITEIDIYAGETAYPLDTSGNPTIAFDEFDVSLNNLNEKSYSVNWIDWFDETNFIIHVKVCPEEILP